MSFYDFAERPLNEGFPESLPGEQTYVYIGMYLGWVIDTKLYSRHFSEAASAAIIRFQRREISCAMLSESWNGHLLFEFFSKKGNSFTMFYHTSGLYRQDYEEILGSDLPAHAADTWANYERLRRRINYRFYEWQKLKALLRAVSVKEWGKARRLVAGC